MVSDTARSSGSLDLSGARLTVGYRLQAVGPAARRMAELVCLDQTVEASDEVIPEGAIRDTLLGRIERVDTLDQRQSIARISFPIELLGRTAADALHLLFGTSSLKPGVRLVGLEFPSEAAFPFRGSRFGRAGLRTLLHVPSRPMVCAVLKPLGLSPKALASLAHDFALGGVDWIKDDQGLADQPFCRFHDRVRACADAVEAANRETGQQCRYIAHINGGTGEIHAQATLAKQAGAAGLLICPGLTGYDAMRRLAMDDAIGLPIFSHPAFLGSYALNPHQGIDPAVLYGMLPRMMGADVSIYPTWGPDFGLERDDCVRIAAATGTTDLPIPPIFPTAAGRIGHEQTAAVREVYGREVVYILGSRIQRAPEGIRAACRRFVQAISD